MARAKGINKAQAYRARIFTIEYDLAAMIDGYTLDFVIDLAHKIASGELPKSACRQDVDRWSAHLQLQQDAKWSAEKHKYFHDLDLAEEVKAA